MDLGHVSDGWVPKTVEVPHDLTVTTDAGRRVVAARRQMAVATLELLDAITLLGSSETHLDGYADAASWVQWHLGVSRRTARSWVRLAEALGELPTLRAAMAEGRLSIEQIELLVRHRGDRTEERLLELAAAFPDLGELRSELVDLPSPSTSSEARLPHLTTHWRDEALHLRGVLPGVDGVMVERALLRIAEQSPKDEQTGLYRDFDTRMGEALVEMASTSLAEEQRADADRATVVVHMAAADLVHRRGDGWDAARRLLSEAEIDRLLCDARVQPALHDAEGVTVGIGRTSRTIPAWLRRVVEGRDQGCRFPGCERTRWLDCHHIVPWSQGGPTNLDNLVSLCGFHHRLIHRLGWIITGHPGRRLTFVNQWGLRHRPAASQFLDDETDRRLRQIDERADRLVAACSEP